jgi:hypothetical protein
MTSVILFFVLLLATYSYSAPIDNDCRDSTTEYECPTGKTIVEHENSMNMKLLSDDESTSVPHIPNELSSSVDVTTESVTHSSRIFEESSFPLSTEMNDKRCVEDFYLTTMDSSIDFDRRAIRPVKFQDEFESTTVDLPENQMEVTTDVEPSSSVDSFGKFTGLLHDDQTSTSDPSTEELPIKTQRLTKTVSIIPGKITETKIYSNSPIKTSVIIEPVEKKQLSQDQKREIIEKA